MHVELTGFITVAPSHAVVEDGLCKSRIAVCVRILRVVIGIILDGKTFGGFVCVVGMPAYSGMNDATLLERIRNERRIELCFEDHRFFDCRR